MRIHHCAALVRYSFEWCRNRERYSLVCSKGGRKLSHDVHSSLYAPGTEAQKGGDAASAARRGGGSARKGPSTRQRRGAAVIQ